MKHVLIFTTLCGLVSIIGCARIETNRALEYAGDNRSELEKVLKHYCDDKEKLKAAEYLVKYMPGHRSLWGDYEEYYDKADSILNLEFQEISLMSKLDSLSQAFGPRLYVDYDSQRVSAEYLIRNIDDAFVQWKDGQWARHLDFDEFCEWLLPYTCSDKLPLDGWREDLKEFAAGEIDHLGICDDYRYNPRSAISIVNYQLAPMIKSQRWISKAHGHALARPESFVKLPGATCDEYAETGTRVMRSKGIPVGIDFTPQWPDRCKGHTWCVFPSVRGRSSQFNPFASNPDYPHYEWATYAKILRRTYRPEESYMSLLRRNGGNVPALVSSPFFKDVTHEYIATSDIHIRLLDGIRLKGSDMYIAVFDNYDWHPVWWGRKKWGKAEFKNMGRDVVYIVYGRDGNGKLVPASAPFLLDTFGDVKYLEWDGQSRADFVATRKYPMFQYVYLVNNVTKGGYVEASNRPDFLEYEVVAELPEWEIVSGSVTVTQSSPYRYWRLTVEDGRTLDMAEMYYYVKGDSAFCVPNITEGSGRQYRNMFDNDPLTNYICKGTSLVGSSDFGQPVELDHISFIKRGDGDAVTPGDEYELSWWNGSGWELFLKDKAADVRIDVKGIPSGVLYYLKDVTRGWDQRIFIVDDSIDGQIWY